MEIAASLIFERKLKLKGDFYPPFLFKLKKEHAHYD
jgi:hypothetical protein